MNTQRSVAIIGLSCRFPEASSLSVFCENLKRGVDSVRPIDRERIHYACLNQSKAYQVSGHLNRVDHFDHAFFNISLREAEAMDPNHRMLLEMAAEAIENAGYSLADVDNRNVAVYLGGKPHSTFYDLLPEKDANAFIGNLHTMVAGRISHKLNLRGPSLMLDTACSSSLIAIHEASQKLLTGEVELALAGGLNIESDFFETAGSGEQSLGILSPDGKCKAFDANANGIGGGEGGGILFLKRLDHAIRDNDYIHAVIRGSAVNHDGRNSNGLTAPSPQAQVEVLQAAWEKAGVNPETITYIEAHGTGTKLGDPIEFQSITEAYQKYTDKKYFCAVSSVKTNIGHLNNAAGVAGVLKAVASLKEKKLFPSLHFHTPNPYISFENSAAFVNAELNDWKVSSPRRCGVSSFGLSGTNGHLVLEEAPPRAHSDNTQTDLMLKISGKNARVLRKYAGAIREFIRTSPEPLPNFLYTLNAGRNEYAFRLLVQASTKDELLEKLDVLQNWPEELWAEHVFKQTQQIILLFSTNQFDSSLVGQLRRNAKANEWLAEVEAKYPGWQPATVFGSIVVQCAIYKWLKAISVPVRMIIASGYGKIAKRVVAGELSLEGAHAEASVERETIIEKPKLKSAIEVLIQEKNIVYCEFGLLKPLAEAILEVQPDLPVLAFGTNGPLTLKGILTDLYNNGILFNWYKVYSQFSRNHYKTEAPTYPFEETRCWYKEPEKVAALNLHKLVWINTALLKPCPTRTSGGAYLLIKDSRGLSPLLAAKLMRAGNKVILVDWGEAFLKSGENSYLINPRQEAGFQHLRRVLTEQGTVCTGVIYLPLFTSATTFSFPAIDADFRDELLPLINLARVFHRELNSTGFHFSLVTTDGCAIGAPDGPKLPLRGAAGGFVKSMLVDNPRLFVSAVDFSSMESVPLERVAQIVGDELFGNHPIRFVGYRNSERFIQSLEPCVKLVEPPCLIQANDVFIVTGGAGGIGMEICASLAKRGKCTLVILSRRKLPPRSAWPSLKATSAEEEKLIQVVTTLEASGSKIDYQSVDITDPSALKKVFAELAAVYPRIKGVIHCAGINYTGLPTHEKELEDSLKVMAPKIQGTCYLMEYCKPFAPEFFVLFSSLNAIVPKKNSYDYAVGNSFLNAVANVSGLKRVVSISWPGWAQTGMGLGAGDPANGALKSLSTIDGIAAFYEALGLSERNVLVAEYDKKSFAVNPFFTVGKVFDDDRSGELDPEAIDGEQLINPATQLKGQIRQFWKEVLKVNQFQDTDDFFEMGGHSLNGAQILNRIHAEYGVKLEMDDLFEYATIQSLSERINVLLQSAQRHGPVGKLEDEKSGYLSSAEYVEACIRNIWKDVLKMASIDDDNDFFEIGGHSLNGAQVLNRIENDFGVKLDFDDLFEHSTIESLSLHLSKHLGTVVNTDSSIPLVGPREYYETSPSQKNFWMHDQFEEGAEACKMYFSHQLKGDVNVNAFSRAINVLVERHEILRTNYALVNGDIVQFVKAFDPTANYLTYTNRHESEAQTMNASAEKSLCALNLEQDQLFQCSLQKLGTDEYSFTLMLHHIQADEWSLMILRKELVSLYNAFCDQKPNPLEPLSLQYKDYASWLNKLLSREGDKLKKFWQKHLEGELVRTTFTTDHPRGDKKSFEGRGYTFALVETEMQAFRNACIRQNTTFFVGCIAVLKLLLYRSCQHDKLVLGVTLSGRNHTELEKQIGNYLNAIPIVSNIDPSENFSAFLTREREIMLNAVRHQAYPFDQIVAHCNIPREAGRTPLFDVQVTWHSFGAQQELNEDLTGITELMPERRLNGVLFDILFVGNEGAKSFSIDYNSDLYNQETIEKIGTDFNKLIHLLSQSLEQPLSHLVDELRRQKDQELFKALNNNSLKVINEEF